MKGDFRFFIAKHFVQFCLCDERDEDGDDNDKKGKKVNEDHVHTLHSCRKFCIYIKYKTYSRNFSEFKESSIYVSFIPFYPYDEILGSPNKWAFIYPFSPLHWNFKRRERRAYEMKAKVILYNKKLQH